MKAAQEAQAAIKAAQEAQAAAAAIIEQAKNQGINVNQTQDTAPENSGNTNSGEGGTEQNT